METLSWGFVLSFAISGVALAATAPVVAPASTSTSGAQLEELDEVLIDGQKPSRKPSEIITWMRRLVGQFTYEGHVDINGRGEPNNLLPITGRRECIGFGPAPAVQCEVHVTWPERKGQNGEEILGAVSALNPAMILYGFEPDELGIRFMIVDSNGIADPGLGLLVGDTLVSRARCVNITGTCQKITRITAEPDGKRIEMNVDVEGDYKRAMSYRFVLTRVGAAVREGP
jgi:hypothetical protein